MNILNLLIVEDEHDIATLYKDYIAELDIKVDIAESAESALKMINQKSYDIFVVDWILPKMSGVDFCKRLRKIKGDYPYVIMATIKDDLDYVSDLLNDGFDDYLYKPISPKDFLIRIKVAQSSVKHRILRREAEKKLANNQEHMSKVLGSLNVGMVLLDRHNNLLYHNEVMYRISHVFLEEGLNFPSQLPLSQDTKRKLEDWLINSHGEKLTIHFQSYKEVWLEFEDISQSGENKVLYISDKTEFMLLKLSKYNMGNILIGDSKAIRDVRMQISTLASGDWNVLVEGETGTGKELAAQLLHSQSPRGDRVFLAVNCAGLTESLAASILFGHKKGSFTGAISDHKGYFEAASGGTLFLDEIGDLPVSIQVMLLRVLESKEITRVGENVGHKVDVRVIAATNRELSKEVAKGNFREDLYYRLNSAKVTLPTLRSRKEDIPILIDHFLFLHKIQYPWITTKVSHHAINILMNYSWPGNVRQLKSVIQYAAVQAVKGIITPDELPDEIYSAPELKIEDEEESIQKALEIANGNHTKAASILGISRATLYRKLKKIKSS